MIRFFRVRVPHLSPLERWVFPIQRRRLATGVRRCRRTSFHLRSEPRYRKLTNMRTKSPFEKYRGIGSPGIRRGKKAVVQWVRNLRGR